MSNQNGNEITVGELLSKEEIDKIAVELIAKKIRKYPPSPSQQVVFQKADEIIELLIGLPIAEIKSVLATINSHLENCSTLNRETYELNVKPFFNNFQ